MKDREEGMLDQLAENLRSACVKAVSDERRRLAGEQIYAYILYTVPEFNYAILLANSEEGLKRLSSHPYYHSCDLRWLPTEWESSHKAEETFNEAQRTMMEAGFGVDQAEQRRRVLVQVLKRLDAEGLFGTGGARETVLVNIMWGDQDVVAHVESARELNPRASYLSYASHELSSLYAIEREIESGRSMYGEQALARVRSVISQVESDIRISSKP